MWIDINGYIGQWPYQKHILDDCATLMHRMNRFGVNRTVVTHLNAIHYKNPQTANRMLYEELQNMAGMKERLIPFAVINPTYAGWQYDLKQSLEEYSMKGIAVYPKYHDYDISDVNLTELARMSIEYDVPVALTLRMVDHRSRFWMDVEKEWMLTDLMPLFRRVPEARYMIRNVANSTRLDNEDMQLMKKVQWLMDTSGRVTNNLEGLIETFGVDKFAFGSHTPILDYVTSRLRIEYLDRNEEEKDKLRYVNATRFLNID